MVVWLVERAMAYEILIGDISGLVIAGICKSI
jgi:hypothetical protein